MEWEGDRTRGARSRQVRRREDKSECERKSLQSVEASGRQEHLWEAAQEQSPPARAITKPVCQCPGYHVPYGSSRHFPEWSTPVCSQQCLPGAPDRWETGVSTWSRATGSVLFLMITLLFISFIAEWPPDFCLREF